MKKPSEAINIVSLDHFGIVAGIIDEMELVEEVNTKVGIRIKETVGCISLLRMCQKRVKMKKLVKSSNKYKANKMIPSDKQQLKAHLKAVAEILYRYTDPTQLKSFG